MKKLFIPLILCFISVSIVSGNSKAPAIIPLVAAQQDAPPAQTGASQVPSVVVDNWIKPLPGWLYILDPRPDVGETGAHVWLLDPQSGTVMGSIRTGYHPDFALSPDGARLYIASDTHVHATQLAVVDTTSGDVLAGETIYDRAIPTVIPAFSTMAVSGDGRSLRILVKKPDSDEFQLDTIDADSGKLLPGHVNVGHCGDGLFVSFPTADHVDFVCPAMKKVHLARTDENSRELDNSYGLFPWNHKLGVGAAFPASGGQFVNIVRGDGAIFQMDTVTLRFFSTAAHGGAPDQVLPSAWPVSPEGTRVYIGYTHSPGAAAVYEAAHELRVYDTKSWKKVGTIKTSIPFWSAIAAPDGRLLYALAPAQHCILVLDAATMRETRTIAVGVMPSLAIVAP